MSRKLNKNSQPCLVTITKKVEKKGKTALFIQNSKSYCYKSIGTFKKDIDENKDKKITRNISVSLPMNDEINVEKETKDQACLIADEEIQDIDEDYPN